MDKKEEVKQILSAKEAEFEEWQTEFTDKIATKYEMRVAELEAKYEQKIAEIFKEIGMARIKSPLTPKHSSTVVVKNYPYLFGFTEAEWQSLEKYLKKQEGIDES